MINVITKDYFYKELNKSALKISSIHATNILVKDRLYNYCFKFYKKLLTYTDEMSKIFDIRLYYFVQLVKVLKKKGFMISKSNNIEFDTFKNIIIPKVIFTSEVFDVELYPDMDNFGLVINVINNSIKNKNSKKATHLLLFNTKTTFKDFEINDIDDKYNSIDIISLWSVKGYDDISKMITSNELKEIELIEKWLEQKMYVVLGNIDIYSQYCPVCKSSYIEETDTKVYLCLDCNSKYSIYKTKENKNEKIWFIKLRRL